MTSQAAFQKQEKVIEYYKKNNPELLERKRTRAETEILEEIGIWNTPKNKPLGYIKLFSQDFIVEEKNQGKILRVNSAYNFDSQKTDENKKNTLYAKMVKMNISTHDAIERVGEYLNFDVEKIGYAGLKDEKAITAQLISFRDSTLSIDKIKEIKIPNIFLTDFYYDTGFLNPGRLDGNVFKIIIRTQEKLDEKEFENKIEKIKKYGCLNYFYSQRFGLQERIINHKLGKLILLGNYELAIRYFLFKTSKDDIPLVSTIRKEAETAYPNWFKAEQIFEKLPYTFFYELKLIRYLKENPKKYIDALTKLKDQVQMWIYGYTSFLFNKYLSQHSLEHGCTDEKFPLLLSYNPKDSDLYKQYLKDDNILNFKKYLRPLEFIKFKRNFVKARVFPQNVNYKIFDYGIVINFELQKGSYATTFLSNLFELCQESQKNIIPKNINLNYFDAKKIINQGDLNELKEIFSDNWKTEIIE